MDGLHGELSGRKEGSRPGGEPPPLALPQSPLSSPAVMHSQAAKNPLSSVKQCSPPPLPPLLAGSSVFQVRDNHGDRGRGVCCAGVAQGHSRSGASAVYGPRERRIP